MLTPAALGAHRVIDPPGALPQAAARGLAPEMPDGGRGLDRLRETVERIEEIADMRELAEATIA